jgi:hypothetical protein
MHHSSDMPLVTDECGGENKPVTRASTSTQWLTAYRCNGAAIGVNTMRKMFLNTTSMLLSSPERPSSTVEASKQAGRNMTAGNDAAKFGASLIGDKFAGMWEEIEGQAAKKLELANGPLSLFWIMDEEGFEWDYVPAVGTSYKEGVNNPETIQVWDAPKEKYVDTNWFKVAFNASPLGRKYQAKLDDLALAMKPETAGQSKLYASFKDDQVYLKDEAKNVGQQRDQAKTAFRNACRVQQVFAALDNLEGVVVKFNEYKDGTGAVQMKRTKYPIILLESLPKGDTTLPKMKALSVGEFLKLDVPYVVELQEADDKLSDYAALLKTLEREPDTNKSLPPIKNGEAFVSYVYSVLNYLDVKTEDGAKHRADLVKAMTLDSGEAQRQAVYDLANVCNMLIELIPAKSRTATTKAA